MENSAVIMKPGPRSRKLAIAAATEKANINLKTEQTKAVTPVIPPTIDTETVPDEAIVIELTNEGDEILTADYLEEVVDEEEEQAINHSSTVFEILSVEYPCEICDEHFSTRSDRNKHIENHFRSFECETCHQTFIGDRQFSYHQTTARCQPSADEPDPPPVPDTDEPTLTEWGCYVCGQKNFQTRRALKLHFNKQHTEKPKRSSANHVCDMCGKAFANQHILKNHVYEIHTNAQEHKCDDCGKQFNRLANLRHHQLIHRNLMPCDCVVCGKSFRTPSGVRLHMRTHTGAKPYKCDLCNEKSYAYNTDLVRHKRSMHGIYGKVFMCALCPSQYYERKHLRKHLTRTHEITDEEQILANIKAPAVKKEK